MQSLGWWAVSIMANAQAWSHLSLVLSLVLVPCRGMSRVEGRSTQKGRAVTLIVRWVTEPPSLSGAMQMSCLGCQLFYPSLSSLALPIHSVPQPHGCDP